MPRRVTENPLDHERRARIYGAIRTAPGLGFRDLAGAVGMARSYGCLSFHINVLRRAGLVVAHGGRPSRLYPTSMGHWPAVQDARLRLPSRAALHRLVRQHPGLAGRQLAPLLPSLSYSSVWQQLVLLEGARLVRSERRGGARLWYPVETDGTSGPVSAAIVRGPGVTAET